MNITKGEWKVYETDHGVFWVGANKQNIATCNGGDLEELSSEEAEANARLIALAGNLNQRYDLSKLEALVESARRMAYQTAGISALSFTQAKRELQSAIRAITRQPAGEKTTTS